MAPWSGRRAAWAFAWVIDPPCPGDGPAAVVDDTAADRLWAFACRLYDRPGVAAACLALQDDWGADVCRLLHACWLGRAGLRPDPAAWQRAAAAAADWQGPVVQPLRAARRALKGRADGAALYQSVKAAELAAERCQLSALAAALSAATGTGPIAVAPDIPAIAAALRQVAPAAPEALLAVLAAATQSIISP